MFSSVINQHTKYVHCCINKKKYKKKKWRTVFKQKSLLVDIRFTKTWHGVHIVMLNKEILLQWKSKQKKSRKNRSILLCYWSYGWHTTTTENSRACAKRNLKAHIFLFKRRERKSRWRHILYSTQYQSSTIPAGRLEIPLKLTFTSPNFIT